MMLGPMKRKMITVGVVSFILPTIALGALFGVYHKKKQEEIDKLNVEKKVVERYVFSGDMPVNHIITSDDIRIVGVKEMSAPQDSYESAGMHEIVGRKLKIAAFDKTIVTENMFYKDEENITNDLRKKEFNMIALPSDLVEGDYIDIRIMFPTGEDYLVVVGKEVKQTGINAESSSIFLELTEEENLKLSSAIIESYISDSVYLYAVKYVDNYQQLFKEKHVDYVVKYENAVETLISGDYALAYEEALVTLQPMRDEEGNVILDEEGRPVFSDEDLPRKTVADYTSEQIALQAGMKVEDVEAIQTAISGDDELLLAFYKNQTEIACDLLTPNYPIRPEVYSLVMMNPNILETLKAKYNIEELENQRINLVDTSSKEEVIDDKTGEWVIKDKDSALSAVASKLDTEIEAQKTDRKEYLQTLIRNNAVAKATAD